MLQGTDISKAIVAIQDLIIRARIMAYENKSNIELAELLDDIEYLPALIVQSQDRTDIFLQYLESICVKFKFLDILTKYNS